MSLDQQGTVVFRILRNDGSRWDVLENDSGKPLATFEDQQDACDYANRLSASRPGSSVVMLDGSNPAPAQGQNRMRP